MVNITNRSHCSTTKHGQKESRRRSGVNFQMLTSVPGGLVSLTVLRCTTMASVNDANYCTQEKEEKEFMSHSARGSWLSSEAVYKWHWFMYDRGFLLLSLSSIEYALIRSFTLPSFFVYNFVIRVNITIQSIPRVSYMDISGSYTRIGDLSVDGKEIWNFNFRNFCCTSCCRTPVEKRYQ